ncbi:MAG: PAS domain-containing protein [Blastocatellia bacterium]
MTTHIVSAPQTRKKTGISRNTGRILAVVSFAAMTILLGIYNSGRLTGYYRQSVINDRMWADRLSEYLKMGELAAAANAPGNNVFSSKDPATERRNLQMATADFKRQLEILEADLASLKKQTVAGDLKTEAAKLEQMARTLSETGWSLGEMAGEAEGVFTHFSEGNLALASQRMAAMDQKYEGLRVSLEKSRQMLAEIRRDNAGIYLEDMKRAEWIGNLVAGILLILNFAGGVMSWKIEQKSEIAGWEKEENLARLKQAEQDAAERLLQYEYMTQIFDAISDPIFVKDDQHRWIFANRAFGEFVGRPPEEFIGKTDYEFFPKAEADHFWRRDNYVFETGITDECEEGNTDASGVTRVIHTRKTPFTDSKGSRVLVGILRDISKQKRSEESLKLSEEFLHGVINAISDAIVVKDADRRTLLMNDAFVEAKGRAREEMIGRSLDDFSDPAPAARLRERDEQVLATGESCEFLETVVRNGGNRHFVSIRKSVFTNAIGQKTLVSISRDISHIKRAEEALRLSENRLRGIVGSLDERVVEVDATGICLNVWSHGARAQVLSGEEVSGKPLMTLYETEHAAAILPVIQRVLASGKPEVIESGDGRGKWLLNSVTPIPAMDGATQSVCLLSRDISARREAEEVLKEDLREFLQVASAVAEGDLTKRSEARDEMLSRALVGVNRILDNFRTMLFEVRQNGLSVSSSATQIQAASAQIAVGTQRQADEITNTSSAVEEMAASMRQVSKNAESSAGAARRALDLAENGDRAMCMTTEAIGRIEAAVQQTADKMHVLETRSSEISEIINLINEIAAQTNLLALNAAIEAAHAGQAGAGFSVVADEIRKLAERSARATRDVGSLIKSIQQEINEAVTAMGRGFGEVRQGSQVAVEAGQALREISSAVKQSAELIEEISAASEEQAVITGKVAEAMQVIAGITVETSAGAHETAQTLQGMVNLAEQMNEAISRFRVDDGSHTERNFEAKTAAMSSRGFRGNSGGNATRQDDRRKDSGGMA